MKEVDEKPQEQVTEPTAQETAPQPSKRDAFRGRISKRYPDLNMEDEDAYYDQMGKTMDEYEGYEKNSQRLRESMSKSPAMAEMLLAARDQEDFDPVVWMVQQKGLDLQALQDDPDYAQKLADAHASYMEKKAASEEIQKNMEENMPKSVEAIRAKAEELGLDETKAEEIVGKMYQVMDDLVNGKIDVDIFELLAKGQNYDTAVSDARDEGRAAGLNQKVDEKLRTLESSPERVSGAQAPVHTPAPKKGPSNMFMADDEDNY